MNVEKNESTVTSSEIDVIRFASHRLRELELLNSEAFLGKENKKKSLFQMLPRHMRRRTMGYIRKRLPHRIRKASIIKPPTAKSSKRPSRKHRRRPSNLRKEYERRKRADKMWLETHIWHAKRFHMSESLYGYRLAVHDNCKCKRAVYKCLKENCCIHDESYYVCHEIKGRQDILLNGLKRLCSTETGLTFAAKMFINGQYEGKTIIYERDKYPYGCLGPCRFMWKSELDNLTEQSVRTLWLWSHPSFHKVLQEQLIQVFDLAEQVDEDFDKEQDESSPQAKKRKLAAEKSTAKNSTTIRYVSINGNECIELVSLKDKLVRFKLIGPLSTTILANALKTIDDDSTTELKNCHSKQADLWNGVNTETKSPNDFVCSTILGLLVKDPRLVLPKKKAFNKVKDEHDSINNTNRSDQGSIGQVRKNVLSHSSLWCREFVEKLNKEKKTTHEINKLRSEYLMPRTELTKIENHSKIPVILVQNANATSVFSIKNGVLFTGWDVILPNTWAMAFWMCFVHFGARAIGQNELNYLLFESGNLQYPAEYCDTKSSKIENEKLKLELYEKYRRRPASKRVNYLKSAFLTPFYLPFNSLLNIHRQLSTNESSNEPFDYFILRNKKLLTQLGDVFFSKNAQHKKVFKSLAFDAKLIDYSYIPVRMSSQGRGTLDRFSLIFNYDQNYAQVNEARATDVKLAMSKITTEYRENFMSTFEQASKTDDKKVEANLNKLLRHKFNKYEMLLDENVFFKYLRELSDSKNYRLPIGFIANGHFNLATGNYSANGFVLTKAIVDICNQASQKNNAKNLFVYQTSNSNQIQRLAKIDHFFI